MRKGLVTSCLLIVRPGCSRFRLRLTPKGMTGCLIVWSVPGSAHTDSFRCAILTSEIVSDGANRSSEGGLIMSVWGSEISGVVKASGVDAPEGVSVEVTPGTEVGGVTISPVLTVVLPEEVRFRVVDSTVLVNPDAAEYVAADTVGLTASEDGVLSLKINGDWVYPLDAEGDLVEADSFGWSAIADLATYEVESPLGGKAPYGFDAELSDEVED